jgi:membrane-associated phospholipid phosphatase
VTPAPAQTPSPSEGRPPRDPRRRWWALSIAGVVVLAASYAGFVLTATGQALENSALRGADQVSTASVAEADSVLHDITLASLGVACVVIGVVGLARRSVALAAAGVGVIVAGQVVSQALKRFVLPRPELVEASADYTGNSFPSGHTTIALTVLAAVLIVVPSRWRGVAMFVIAWWAVGIGAYTLTAKWHRFSDTLGAAGVTLVVASLAALWLHGRGLVRPVAGPPHRWRVVLVVAPLAALAVVSAALGLFLLAAGGDLLARDPVTEYNAYLGLQALAGAGSVATALALWWSWHRLEVVPVPARRAAGAQPAVASR